MRPKANLKQLVLSAVMVATVLLVSLWTTPSLAQVGNYASRTTAGRSVVITGAAGESIRITPYGDYMVRVQTVRKGETFYADDRYELVETHSWTGALDVVETTSSLTVSTGAADGVSISIAKQPLRLSFSIKNQGSALLAEKDGVTWSGNTVTESFASTTDEHFAGLGHEAFGRIAKLDRRGTTLKVSKGDQGALRVPFYLSSRGYGVLLNTTFTHTITLAQNSVYSLNIDGEGYGGQMDYFFIAGPSLSQVVDRYTQLTGRPRLPQKSLFGLLLSDKTDPDNNGEPWWKQMITDHRNAGYAFDHQVNDNAWRASNSTGSSTQQNSWFEFRKDRYPDPAEYKAWCDTNGVTVTLDLNRPGLSITPGWSDATYGMPGTMACPDLTNVATRKWLWQLFFSKALDPALKYPGDSIWLDEFDYPDQTHSMTLSSGKRWAEESINYQLDLLKGCVKEGWDTAIGEAKRPYFWSRGMTAGGQRWGSYWTGDLDGNYTEMAYQVRALQAAGISGFPYFNHDAGGHLNLTVNEDNIYRQWDMAFGSFTPIWKPHGPSHKRWPLQRDAVSQSTAKTFITNRYQMIPYIYSYARIAQATGVPMARPMFLDDQANATAWQNDLQYMWGKEMLVAPNCSDGNNNVSVWLPKGNWYSFWDDTKHVGNTTESVAAATGVIPVFVKEGAIVPMAPFAKSTFFIPKDSLLIHVYTGIDGSFDLYEDDGVTERFRTQSESRLTTLRFTQQDLGVEIAAAQGTYSGASSSRTYQVTYHGLSAKTSMYINGTAVTAYSSQSGIPANGDGTVWDATKMLLTVYVASRSVGGAVKISSTGSLPGTGGASGNGGMAGNGGVGGTASGGSSGSSSGGAGGGGGGASGSTGGVSGGAGGASSGAGGSSSGAGGSSSGAGGSSSGAGGLSGSGSGGVTASGGSPGNSGGTNGAASGGNMGTGGSSPGASAGGGSGCSCHVGGGSPSEGALPLVGLLVAAVGLRRRRSRRSR